MPPKILCLRTTMAQDPLKVQYEQCTPQREKAERVGRFEAWDPDHGAWPLSMHQRSIIREVTRVIDDDWIEHTLYPMTDTSDTRVEPSLRTIDWFVTNFSKSHDVDIAGKHVHSEYEQTRVDYQCRHFDPFRRNLKLTFELAGGTEHTTTVAQLNFVQWADALGVLDYVRTHRESIVQDMAVTCHKRRQEHASSQGPRKRTPLSRGFKHPCRMLKCARVTSLEGTVVRS
jgi:hypothetical protein